MPYPNGFFIDVGSFDGRTYSNTLGFIEKGWEGICIEPVTENYHKLIKEHENNKVLCLNLACGDKNEELTMYISTETTDPSYGSDTATFDKNQMDNISKLYPSLIWREEKIQLLTLDTVIGTVGIPRFDLLCIDVEGYDYKVLLGLDISKYRPFVICIERNNDDEGNKIASYLMNNGYIMYANVVNDLIFVNKKG